MALVAGAVIFFLRRRKRAVLMDEQKRLPAANDFKGPGYASPPPQPDMVKYERQAPMVELSDTRETIEMGAASPTLKRGVNELPA